MDERELLVLGLLKSQSQHGYQINEFIETVLGQVTDMKKSTAYTILKRLEKEGHASVTNQQEGNRPMRQVYSITQKGEERFQQLLRNNLCHVENMAVPGQIGMMFMDHLPLQEVVLLLEKRLEKVNEIWEKYRVTPEHEGIGVDLGISYRLELLNTARNWLQKTITNLSHQGK